MSDSDLRNFIMDNMYDPLTRSHLSAEHAKL